MKKILVFLAAVLLLSTSSWAFNGVRKGFVLGGGLGFAPAAKWSVDDYYMGMQLDTSETKAGVGLNLLVGYAWDEHNMIVYEGNVAGYKSDFFRISRWIRGTEPPPRGSTAPRGIIITGRPDVHSSRLSVSDSITSRLRISKRTMRVGRFCSVPGTSLPVTCSSACICPAAALPAMVSILSMATSACSCLLSRFRAAVTTIFEPDCQGSPVFFVRF